MHNNPVKLRKYNKLKKQHRFFSSHRELDKIDNDNGIRHNLNFKI
jgi:hypothetical protein